MDLLKKLDWDKEEFSTVWGHPHTEGPGANCPYCPYCPLPPLSAALVPDVA